MLKYFTYVFAFIAAAATSHGIEYNITEGQCFSNRSRAVYLKCAIADNTPRGVSKEEMRALAAAISAAEQAQEDTSFTNSARQFKKANDVFKKALNIEIKRADHGVHFNILMRTPDSPQLTDIPVGHIAACFKKNEGTIHIHHLKVKKAHRKKGYATDAMNTFFGIYSAQSRRHLPFTHYSLGVATFNIHARTLYQKLGFEKSGNSAQPGQILMKKMRTLKPLNASSNIAQRQIITLPKNELIDLSALTPMDLLKILKNIMHKLTQDHNKQITLTGDEFYTCNVYAESANEALDKIMPPSWH